MSESRREGSGSRVLGGGVPRKEWEEEGESEDDGDDCAMASM